MVTEKKYVKADSLAILSYFLILVFSPKGIICRAFISWNIYLQFSYQISYPARNVYFIFDRVGLLFLGGLFRAISYLQFTPTLHQRNQNDPDRKNTNKALLKIW